MAKSAQILAAFIVGLIVCWVFMTYILPPVIDGNGPPDQFSQNAKFLVGVSDWANESSTDPMTGGLLSIYDMTWNLKEAVSVSSRTFTSALYYSSGDVLRYKLATAGFETISGTFSMPYYDSQEIVPFHILNNLEVSRNPSTKTTFSVNGVYNVTNTVVYDVSVSGNTMELSVEFYNIRDETRLMNYLDSVYEYEPLVLIENLYYNATAVPLDVKIQGLELVRAETSTQTGLYIALPAETSLNRDRNQASGILVENNRISISFTVDVSQVGGSELGFLRFTLYDNTDIDYFRTYGNVLSSAITYESISTYNIIIQA